MIPGGRSGSYIKERAEASVDMVPMMNLFTVLVPVLLLAAVFANITVLDLEAPPPASGEESAVPGAEPDPLNLVVIVAAEGITVGGNGGFLPTLLREEGRVDEEKLAALLAGVQSEHPDNSKVTVASEQGITYEQVIAVMDICREAGFTAIALSALHGNTPGENSR